MFDSEISDAYFVPSDRSRFVDRDLSVFSLPQDPLSLGVRRDGLTTEVPSRTPETRVTNHPLSPYPSRSDSSGRTSVTSETLPGRSVWSYVLRDQGEVSDGQMDGLERNRLELV